MNSLLQITLGIVTAMGGYVDIGELVFSIEAGSRFGFLLLWAIAIGTVGIIVFSEMSGRIAAVLHKPVFTLVKQRFGYKGGLTVLCASTALNVLTCAAEMGGVAIALEFLTGLDPTSALLITVFTFITITWLLPFSYIEKTLGILGLFMIIFLIVNIKTGLNSKQILQGFTFTLPNGNTHQLVSYLYYAVGIISSSMMPYEVYFYSSGGIEEKWSPKDLFDNKMTVFVGMCLGALLSGSLLMLGSKIFAFEHISPQLQTTAALAVSSEYGTWGAILALLGIVFSVAGATIETCFAGAYNIAQFFEWRWGRHLKPERTRAFTVTWIGIFLFAYIVILFGIDPIDLVEYAVIFSVIALPFTYYPILKVASDKRLMGQYVNGNIARILGWLYFIVVCILAISAIPLMILSHNGKL
jgi:Mn2+/Fe2+ NRAMP family transporter